MILKNIKFILEDSEIYNVIERDQILKLIKKQKNFKHKKGITKLGYADSVSLHQIEIFKEIEKIPDLDINNPLKRWPDGKYEVFGSMPPGKLNLPKDEYYGLMGKLWDKMRESLLADIFITGANALSVKGQIVSIDGTGNRVSAMAFGPSKIIIVVGRNKITKDLTKNNFSQNILKEFSIGILNGIIFALISAAVVQLWFNDTTLSLIISISMILNMIVAGLFGILVTVTLKKMNIDPAIASSVFVTTITDVIGFLSFLGIGAYFFLN